jgi:Na+/H+ antiporter NhaC
MQSGCAAGWSCLVCAGYVKSFDFPGEGRVTRSIVVLTAAVTRGGLTGLASSALALLSKIGSLLLIVFIGYKALGHIAQDQFGKAIGLIVIALIPGLFLFDPSGASRLIQSTVKTLTGG